MSDKSNISQNEFKPYVPLHCHSHYSLLDGFCSPGDLAKAANDMGCGSIALTDHGSCGGLFTFYKSCHKYGIKPILGMEAYFVNDVGIRDKNENRLHVTLLAKNKLGYKNLIAISTESCLNGFYFRPRVDFEILKKHKDGIICGSACIGGVIADPLLKNNTSLAEENATKFKELYGDDFFVEVMLHEYDDKEKEERFKNVMRQVYAIAKKLNIIAVATCDSHYISKEDGKMHDVILCISSKDTIKNPNRMSFGSSDFYLKSYKEMLDLYSKTPELVTNTAKIAERIEDNLIDIGSDLLPPFSLPDGESSESEYLKKLAIKGMKDRGVFDKKEYQQRMKDELEIINGCGFARYFLILWDVIDFAKKNKITTGPGRGSGVASLCLYCLGITHVDPIEHNLLFSRFLNKDRISPPDVDMDFDYSRQGEIFNYVQSKYGADHTARIGTYNGLKAKDAVRRVAKVLDIGCDFEPSTSGKGHWKSGKKTLEIVNQITKSMPSVPNVTLKDVVELKVMGSSKEREKERIGILKGFIEQYPEVFKNAEKVEGNLSASGVHPAGIIVCKDPVTEHVPLRMSNGVICTQYDLKEVEELGLLKFDFLALKTLMLVDTCIKMVEDRRWNNKKRIDINTIKPDKKKVFEMLNNGDTDGVFQFEGWGITKLIQDLRIDSFEDMIVANAMYRPGTLSAKIHEKYCDYKHGKKETEYLHPKMKELLGDTYGMMIYQEQVMLIAMEMAGFSPVEADTLRKGMGKKDPEKIQKLKEKFINGCIKNGVSSGIANKIFALCEFFSGYGFNKSHAAAYAYLAYQTAWLKCFFRPEFMCSLLSTVISEQTKEQRIRYENSLQRFGLQLLPYDINYSKKVYTLEKGGIRPPLSALRGIGDVAIDNIVDNQPYKDIKDFAEKHTFDTGVGKSVVEVLIDAGCVKQWGSDKQKIVTVFLDYKEKTRKKEAYRKKKESEDKKFSGSLF
jgi:DNA polymerase III subunit alpha